MLCFLAQIVCRQGRLLYFASGCKFHCNLKGPFWKSKTGVICNVFCLAQSTGVESLVPLNLATLKEMYGLN